MCHVLFSILYSGGSNNVFLLLRPPLLFPLLPSSSYSYSLDPSFHLSSSSSGLLLGGDSARELSNPPPQANPPMRMMFPAPGGLAFNPGGSGARFARGRGVNEGGRGGGGLVGGFRAGGVVAGSSANGISAASMAHSGLRGTIPGYGQPARPVGGTAAGGEWRGPFMAANFAAGLAAGYGGFGAQGAGRWAPVADQTPTHWYVSSRRIVCLYVSVVGKSMRDALKL